MFKQSSGHLAAAALGALLCLPALSQTPAASGPWAKVPALTTACYSGADPFVAKLEAARSAINADLSKQQAVNAKIRDAHQSIDPMEMAARMQQWLMSNPQEATKYMQSVQAVGAEAPVQQEADHAKVQAFEAERKDLFKRYEAALAQAYAPATARQKAMDKKLEHPDPSWAIDGIGGYIWTYPETNAIHRMMDAAYEAVCPQWWGATGPIHAYLKKYRTWVAQEHIPVLENYDAMNAENYAIMNTPAASYKSTASFDGVLEYIAAVSLVFGERRDEAMCAQDRCKDR